MHIFFKSRACEFILRKDFFFPLCASAKIFSKAFGYSAKSASEIHVPPFEKRDTLCPKSGVEMTDTKNIWGFIFLSI